MTDLSEPLFLFGPGYSAQALARLWTGPVRGSVRSDASRAKLADTGIEPIRIDDDAALVGAIEKAHVVISTPPDEQGCPAYRRFAAHADRALSVTYLSTTGVYGDLNGGWAMEWTAPQPQSVRAQRRVLAEQAWGSVAAPLRIVRLPGIYGPGRSALDRVRNGTARRIVKPGQVFSRIHVADIATGLHALRRSTHHGVFHLCDDYAAPPQDVIAFAADLLSMPPPPEIAIEAADLSEMGRSFYAECKRVSNARIKAATGWRPRFPTYREGLRAILQAGA